MELPFLEILILGNGLDHTTLKSCFGKMLGTLNLKEDEPLFYVEFLTDRPIILKRFVTTAKLMDYATACSTSPFKIEKNVPLISRYKRFKSARMNSLVLNEIKKNLID
jgi:hypothetical protein